MSLQNEFTQAAEQLLTVDFGPAELPDLNRPAVFHYAEPARPREVPVVNNKDVEYCLLVEYTAEERRSDKIEIGDLRFIVLQRELDVAPSPANTKFTWNGQLFQVVQSVRLGAAAYDIQARIS